MFSTSLTRTNEPPQPSPLPPPPNSRFNLEDSINTTPPIVTCSRDVTIRGGSIFGELDSPVRIEIEPGIFSELRGSDETWEAIVEDMYMPTACSCCTSLVFAIQDCGYVLCPNCRIVFPAWDDRGTMIDPVKSGVGIGFTFEQLVAWQSDIERERDHRRR
jgi:hypothetical protein